MVTERLQSVQTNLPGGVEQPKLAPISTAVGEILRLGLITDDKTSSMELRTLVDWVIRPRLMAIPGVANLVIYGGDVREYQVLCGPQQAE